MNSGKRRFILSAITFEAIFASTSYKEIGLQVLDHSHLGLFFSMSVITACLWDGPIVPLTKDSLKPSTKESQKVLKNFISRPSFPGTLFNRKEFNFFFFVFLYAY